MNSNLFCFQAQCYFNVHSKNMENSESEKEITEIIWVMHGFKEKTARF